MTKEAKRTEIEKLIDKAADARNGLEAMQYAQAALNAANAMCALGTAEAQS